jgi:FHS family Na+ dependent glucose MFS transporter 1
MLIALFLALYAGAEVSFGGWIFTYSIKLNLSSETTAAYLTSAFWGTFTLGRLLAIPLATRFRPRSILFSDLVACLVCVGIILSWPHSLIVLWLGTLGTGLAMASVFATMLSMAERLMTITGKMTGWFLVGASGGAMSVPWLIGQFFEFIGPKAMMFIIMADMFLATGVLVVLIVLFGDSHHSTTTSDELLDKVESSDP